MQRSLPSRKKKSFSLPLKHVDNFTISVLYEKQALMYDAFGAMKSATLHQSSQIQKVKRIAYVK